MRTLVKYALAVGLVIGTHLAVYYNGKRDGCQQSLADTKSTNALSYEVRELMDNSAKFVVALNNERDAELYGAWLHLAEVCDNDCMDLPEAMLGDGIPQYAFPVAAKFKMGKEEAWVVLGIYENGQFFGGTTPVYRVYLPYMGTLMRVDLTQGGDVRYLAVDEFHGGKSGSQWKVLESLDAPKVRDTARHLLVTKWKEIHGERAAPSRI